MKMYGIDYFQEGIFETNYAAIAKIIMEQYSPKKIIEIGCGNGYLTKELSKLGAEVFAIDGFSNPSFDDVNIKFKRVDLNDKNELLDIFTDLKYDLAICMEVAEHLENLTSDFLVSSLIKMAPIVVFSAAVPYQGGHGHINCQPRDFWTKLFIKHSFYPQDQLRLYFREYSDIAVWYTLNTLVFVSKKYSDAPEKYYDLVESFIKSESYSTSLYFKASNEIVRLENILNQKPIKFYLKLRNWAKILLYGNKK